MTAQMLVDAILLMLGLSAAIFVLCMAVGFLLVVYEEIVDLVETMRYRTWVRKEADEGVKEQREQRIARMEQELGINTRKKETA